MGVKTVTCFCWSNWSPAADTEPKQQPQIPARCDARAVAPEPPVHFRLRCPPTDGWVESLPMPAKASGRSGCSPRRSDAGGWVAVTKVSAPGTEGWSTR